MAQKPLPTLHVSDLAQRPLPTLHVSDLGEDSCTSKGTSKVPSLLGAWPWRTWIPNPSPVLWNHFNCRQHTEVRLQGTSTLGRDQSGCRLFKWSETNPKLGPFPSNPHLKCLRQVRRTFAGIFAGGISVYVNGQLGLAWPPCPRPTPQDFSSPGSPSSPSSLS